MSKTSSAPNGLAPTHGAILDLKPALHFIYNSSLVVLSELLGFEDFMELMCVVVVSEDENPQEDLESFLNDEDLYRLSIWNTDIPELHYDLVCFQRFMNTDLMKGLSLKTQINFDEYGYRISKWISATEVIVESNESDIVRAKGSVHRFRSSTFQEVGSDRRSAGNSQTVRDRERIESRYIPF